MYINVLSFNVYQYNGYGEGYEQDKRDSKDIERTYNNLFKKMFDIININNINVVFLQEDNSELNKKSIEKFKNIDFEQISFHHSGNDKLINSVYIKKSLLINNPHPEILVGELNNEYQENSFIALKLKLYSKDIVMVNTQICGGELVDKSFMDNIKDNKLDKCFEISNIRNKQIISIFDQVKKKFGIFPTIFGGDLNSIHPDNFDHTKLNYELLEIYTVDIPQPIIKPHIRDDEIIDIGTQPPLPLPLHRQDSEPNQTSFLLNDKQFLIRKFITKGHNLLNSFKLKTEINNENTMKDFIYHDDKKLNIISSDIIKIISDNTGVSNHNPIIYSYKIILDNYDDFFCEHHENYKDNYLYKCVIDKINANIDFLKNHIDINLTDPIKIYNFFLINYLNKDIKNILDNLFNKIKINKNQLFINGFNPPSFRNILLNDNLKDKCNDEILDELKNQIFNEHIKELNDNKTSKFKEIFNFFDIKKRDKGAIYTTSNFNEETGEFNNMKLSLSSEFFGNNYNQTNMLKLLLPSEDIFLYDLSSSNFKRRTLFRMILTNILTNGKYDYNINYKDVKELTDDGTIPFKNQIIVQYPTQCKELLDNDIYKKINDKYEKINLNPLCISGFWDGDKNFDEKINNHFIDVYNSYNIYNKQIIGYVSFDSNFIEEKSETIYNREIVWFSQQLHLKNNSIFFKNHIIYKNTDLYKTIYKFCSENLDKILAKTQIDITDDTIKTLSDELQKHPLRIRGMISDPKISYQDNVKFIENTIIDIQDFKSKLDDPKAGNIRPEEDIIKSKEPEYLRGGKIDYYKKYLKYKKLYMELK